MDKIIELIKQACYTTLNGVAFNETKDFALEILSILTEKEPIADGE